MKFINSLIISSLLGAQIFAAPLSEAERAQAYAKLFKTFRIIEANYVDEINTAELVDKALAGLLAELDAHSSYLDEKGFKALQESTRGEFGGLGITVGMKDKSLSVIAPIEGTPAANAGIKPGDVILKINNELTSGMNLDDAVNKMRGKPGTKITLEIYRKGESKPKKLTITRAIIKIQSVYAKKIEGSSALYVRVTSFDEKVTSGVAKALSEHPQASSLVLDLRANPGGLLDQATGLLNLFIAKGVLVSQKGRDEGSKLETRAVASKAKFANLPMVVLVDGGSASASEIVSGALQDHRRAIIVGERTFGKGSVQIIRPLGESDALKLTVAKYYLPSGRTIQALGVTPDVIAHAGKVAEQSEGFSYSERELGKHLSNEQEQSAAEKKAAGAGAGAAEKKTAGAGDGKGGEAGEKKGDDKIITAREIANDAQLKAALDALAVQQIMQGITPHNAASTASKQNAK